MIPIISKSLNIPPSLRVIKWAKELGNHFSIYAPLSPECMSYLASIHRNHGIDTCYRFMLFCVFNHKRRPGFSATKAFKCREKLDACWTEFCESNS